ncbi:MAG: tetratricopeptide repeat protein, partial [Chthoniobacteraceae bacterium]
KSVAECADLLLERLSLLQNRLGNNAPALAPEAAEAVAQKAFGRRTPTSFIGREVDLRRVSELLGEFSLVTLLGAGGSGKSRLAEEIRSRSEAQYPDGCWQVELAALKDPNLLPGEIAKALGLKEQQEKPPTDILSEYLSSRQALLVLDNCEHLVESSAAVITEIIAKGAKVRVLATSRVKLNVGGEKLWPVGPLGLPGREAHTSEEIATAEAVRLFKARAQSNEDGFEITDENALRVSEICRFLDGIPLALEIAAAKYPDYSLELICESLGEVLSLLENEQAGAPERHKTMRATIEWSYNLLSNSPQLQQMLRRLCVFRGGCSLQAAMQVCYGSALSTLEATKLLSALVNSSLVMLEHVTAECDPSRRRFRILETIRQFGESALDAAERDELQRRHRDWCIDFAEKRAAILEAGGNQQDVLRQFELEHDNIRGAMDWCTEHADSLSGLRLGVSMWRFWEVRGYYSEGQQELGDLIRTPLTEENAALLGWAHSGLGMLYYRQGRFADAKVVFNRALEIETDRKDARRIGICLNDLGITAQMSGDYDEAFRLYREVLAAAQQGGDARQIGVANFNCGNAALNLGQLDEADPLLRESLERFKKGEFESDVGYPMAALAWLAFWRGDWNQAQGGFAEVLANRIKIDSKRGIFDAVEGLTRTAIAKGDMRVACEELGKGFVLALELGAELPVARQLEAAALLAGRLGRPALSLTFFAAASRLRKSIGCPASPPHAAVFRASEEDAVKALAPAAEAKAREEGASMSRDQLMDLAKTLEPG